MHSPPAQVKIWFTERLEPALSKIEVFDSSGQQVDKRNVQADKSDAILLSVSLRPLQPGKYKVVWRVVSVDTHVTTGNFAFELKGSPGLPTLLSGSILRLLYNFAWKIWIVEIVSSLLWLWAISASMTGVGFVAALSPEIWPTVLFGTQFGHLWIIRSTIGLILGSSLWLIAARRLIKDEFSGDPAWRSGDGSTCIPGLDRTRGCRCWPLRIRTSRQ